MRYLLSLLVFFMMSCIAQKPSGQITQGIYGKLLLKQGNQMPRPGKKISAGQPVKRIILIYKLTNINDAQQNGAYFSAIKTALVAKTSSDKKGNFKITLPAGEYSVFVQEKEGLYANYFNGKGSINPVEVLPDSLTQKDIVISNKAFF